MHAIAHVTDLHLGEAPPSGCQVDSERNWARVLQHLQAEPVNQIVLGGDLGSEQTYDSLFRSLDTLQPSVRIVPGNHDCVAELAKHYPYATSGDELFSAEDRLEKWRQLFLDTSTERISPSQLAWLKEQLKRSEEVIIFVHHPILPIDTPIDHLYPMEPESRKTLRELLFAHKHPVHLCCGHYHMEDESTEANVQQFTTPAVSFQTQKKTDTLQFDNQSFGYRRIQISDKGIETKVIRFAID